MKTSFLLVAATMESSLGFSMLRNAKIATTIRSTKDREIIQSGAGDPFRLVDMDMEHAQDCAEHFGKCSVTELKQIKDELHQHRIQNLVLGDEGPESAIQSRMIEEEINLQLNLLKNEMPPSTLFPEEDPPMVEIHQKKSEELAEKVKHEEQAFILEELAEEGVLDSLAICALIGFLMLAPQFL